MNTEQETCDNFNNTVENKLDSQENTLSEGITVDEDEPDSWSIRRYPGPNNAWSRWFRLTAVCLLLLCVLLLTIVTVLGIKYNNLNAQHNHQQVTYNSLIMEREQFQTSYDNLTKERDQLQTSYSTMTKERDWLHSSNYQNEVKLKELTKEIIVLQARYDYMANKSTELQAENLRMKMAVIASGVRGNPIMQGMRIVL
ncbi:hypothetical protein Baya_10663 [Bagarius yarrelli]|uniref:Uncharacterized protein n=1 Tax=Bagarius yarrelli TaxID=175774 RepID=A0A556UG39_BAGYA|nr:hypothetical protein Baya_10663 [Bagarius yarrelli]